MLTEVCKDVCVEPQLHVMTGETLCETTANKSNEARLDIAARDFWISGQKTFFDKRVFNPISKRYRNSGISKAYDVNEKEKKRHYNQRKLDIVIIFWETITSFLAALFTLLFISLDLFSNKANGKQIHESGKQPL